VLIWNVHDLAETTASKPVGYLPLDELQFQRIDSVSSVPPSPRRLVDTVKSVQYILHAHSRAVSDINWSPFGQECIATCSYDSYVHIWDLNASTTKPVTSVSAWTGNSLKGFM
jgi:WD40 repeat protein